MLATGTEKDMMTQEEEQQSLTADVSNRQLSRGLSKVAVVGILALGFVGFVLVFPKETNHDTLISDTKGLEDIVSLSRRRKWKPDYGVCKEQCGKLAAGCKAKHKSKKAVVAAKAYSAKKLCDGKCALSKFVKDTTTGFESWAGDSFTGKTLEVLGNTFEPVEDVLDAADSAVNWLLDTREKVLNFEAKLKRKGCLAKCYAKSTEKMIHDFASKKKAEMICYVAQSKAYYMKMLSLPGEIKNWTHDWVEEKIDDVKEKIDDAAEAVKQQVNKTLRSAANATREFVRETENPLIRTTMDVVHFYNNVLLPIYRTIENIKTSVKFLREEVKNMKHCIHDAIRDAKLIGSIPSYFSDESVAQERVLAFTVRGLALISLSIAITFE